MSDFNEVRKIDLLPFTEANYTQDMTLEEFATYTIMAVLFRYLFQIHTYSLTASNRLLPLPQP